MRLCVLAHLLAFVALAFADSNTDFHVMLVDTPDALQAAVNGGDARHVVITQHLDLTSLVPVDHEGTPVVLRPHAGLASIKGFCGPAGGLTDPTLLHWLATVPLKDGSCMLQANHALVASDATQGGPAKLLLSGLWMWRGGVPGPFDGSWSWLFRGGQLWMANVTMLFPVADRGALVAHDSSVYCEGIVLHGTDAAPHRRPGVLFHNSLASVYIGELHGLRTYVFLDHSALFLRAVYAASASAAASAADPTIIMTAGSAVYSDNPYERVYDEEADKAVPPQPPGLLDNSGPSPFLSASDPWVRRVAEEYKTVLRTLDSPIDSAAQAVAPTAVPAAR